MRSSRAPTARAITRGVVLFRHRPCGGRRLACYSCRERYGADRRRSPRHVGPSIGLLCRPTSNDFSVDSAAPSGWRYDTIFVGAAAGAADSPLGRELANRSMATIALRAAPTTSRPAAPAKAARHRCSCQRKRRRLRRRAPFRNRYAGLPPDNCSSVTYGFYGVPGAKLKDRSRALETRKAELIDLLANAEETPPLRHPNIAEVFWQRISALRESLRDEDGKAEAVEVFRTLIDQVRLVLDDGRLAIVLRGSGQPQHPIVAIGRARGPKARGVRPLMPPRSEALL